MENTALTVKAIESELERLVTSLAEASAGPVKNTMNEMVGSNILTSLTAASILAVFLAAAIFTIRYMFKKHIPSMRYKDDQDMAKGFTIVLGAAGVIVFFIGVVVNLQIALQIYLYPNAYIANKILESLHK